MVAAPESYYSLVVPERVAHTPAGQGLNAKAWDDYCAMQRYWRCQRMRLPWVKNLAIAGNHLLECTHTGAHRARDFCASLDDRQD